MRIKVYVREGPNNTCFYLETTNQTKFWEVCQDILKNGFFTANEDGPIWFPPFKIYSVRMDEK